MTKEKREFVALMENWISIAGMFLGVSSFVIWAVLVVIDALKHLGNPYIGVFLYLVAPAIFAGSILLILIGMLWAKRRMKKLGHVPTAPVIDFGNAKTLRKFLVFCAAFCVVAVLAGFGAYRAYHFTESVEFCGKVCHTVMEPEYTAFQNSPHSNTDCVECHIGPGAEWFVKAKLSGIRQVFAVMGDSFHRPIHTPVHNLRPAKETCQECHWPEKFFGAVLRTWTYFRSDEENSPWTVKMLLNIGGGNPEHGRVNGIHWHMEGVNVIEYVATDDKRLEIPWIRATDQDGNVTIYRTEDEDAAITDEQAATMEKRTMDCIDCHNRPTHRYWSPNEALDMALLDGSVDKSMPSIKYNAGDLLAGEYETREEAHEAIEAGLREEYEDHPSIEKAIEGVLGIYDRNFFPEMKTRWDAFPHHLGHKITPGCFRCHDGKHVSDTGERIRNDCNICHTILAQGEGTELATLDAAGLEFVHPEDIEEEWKTERCDSCHTGSP